MKYRLTEAQNKLVNELRKAREIKEQEFIMQSFHPTANEGLEGGGALPAVKKHLPDVQGSEASGSDIYF